MVVTFFLVILTNQFLQCTSESLSLATCMRRLRSEIYNMTLWCIFYAHALSKIIITTPYISNSYIVTLPVLIVQSKSHQNIHVKDFSLPATIEAEIDVLSEGPSTSYGETTYTRRN